MLWDGRKHVAMEGEVNMPFLSPDKLQRGLKTQERTLTLREYLTKRG